MIMYPACLLFLLSLLLSLETENHSVIHVLYATAHPKLTGLQSWLSQLSSATTSSLTQVSLEISATEVTGTAQVIR